MAIDEGSRVIRHALADDVLREPFVTKGFRQRVKLVVRVEGFNGSSGRRC